MFSKILKIIVSVLFIPIGVSVTAAFYETVVSIRAVSDAGQIFILGAFVYCVIHLMFFRLDFLIFENLLGQKQGSNQHHTCEESPYPS